jgi:hypothetical protein
LNHRFINKNPLLRVCVAAALLAALGGGVFAKGEAEADASQAPKAPQTPNASQMPSAPAYWTGGGASGLSIAVLTPEGKGLAEGEAYLPAMVQGVIVGDFTKFSAMKVLDRQNLDKIIAEGESGFYANESNFAQLGSVANVQHILNGVLQKTGQGFSLQLKVSDISGVSRAAYTGSCTAAELENLTGIKKASAELLAALGVTLTDAGRTGLLGVTSANVQAETALARGVTAQRSGTVIEAMSYYYEAARFDPSLAEAANRNSNLTESITSGNIGQDVRANIQQYKEQRDAYINTLNTWTKTLNEAVTFFKTHPPYEIIYDPALTQGKIDYANETVPISFRLKIVGTTGLKIIRDLRAGLSTLSARRRELAKAFEGVEWQWRSNFNVDSIFSAIPDTYDVGAALINENGETISRKTWRLQPKNIRQVGFGNADWTLEFSNVDANKITDKMTLSIVSVNGVDAKTAGQRGYMSITAENFDVLEGLFKIRWSLGEIEITGYKGNSRSVVIPSNIGRWPVTSIGKSAFTERDLLSVTIPNSVTYIGEWAFDRNPLLRITLPANVRVAISFHSYYGEEYEGTPGKYAYEKNGKKAGTYTRSTANSSDWTYRP